MWAINQPREGLRQSFSAAACAWGRNRIDVFWRAETGRLRQLWWDLTHDNPDNPLAGRWFTFDHAETVSESLSACSWGPGRIDVFWRESPTRLMQKSWVGRWELVPHTITDGGPVAVCSWGPDRIDIFWVAAGGGQLIHRWWDGRTWDNQESIPQPVTGPLAAEITACTWGPGRLDVFWREASGRLGQFWTGRHGSDAWQHFSHEANFAGRPAAASWAPGVIDIFVRTSDQHMLHKWWEAGWSDWVQRPGLYTTSPAVCSWGDGRLDLFAAGTDGNCWQLGYEGRPVSSHPELVRTVNDFARNYHGDDKARRLMASFATAQLFPGCTGTMISPHILLAAGHCGGVGHIRPVQMFNIDQFARPGTPNSQALSEAFISRGFPWSYFEHGDSQLFWLPDASDGTPPGIRYGYVDISEVDPAVGVHAYSFWVNPASREDRTLLFSEGAAIRQQDGPSWPGESTIYSVWGFPGASGSSVIAIEHGHRIVGVTQGADAINGGDRTVTDISAVMRTFDADRNSVLDAVEYDWLMTRPIEDFLFFTFESPLHRARWVAVPDGSAVGPHERIGSLDRNPIMQAHSASADGWWEQHSRFRPNQTYRISVLANVTGSGGSGYVKFVSDSTNQTRSFLFRGSGAIQTGSVTLGSEADYRLVLGASAGSTVEVIALSIVAEGSPGLVPGLPAITVGFATHDQRRSWDYVGECRPVSRGVNDLGGFSGAVIGPTEPDGGLRNAWLGLHQSRQYCVQFQTRAVEGAADPAYPPGAPPSGSPCCWLKMVGALVPPLFWGLGAPGTVRDHELIISATSVPLTLAFGRTGRGTYLLSDLTITPA